MLNADIISFREFVMHEPLPLSKIPRIEMTDGEVTKLLRERNASDFAVNFWHEIVEQDLTVDEDDDLSF